MGFALRVRLEWMLWHRDVSRQRWLHAAFWGRNVVDYQQVLGAVLRDVRLHAGLTHDDCADVVSRAHLRQIERGMSVVRIDTLSALCGVLGITTSQLLLVVEARIDGVSVSDCLAKSTQQLQMLIESGALSPVSADQAARGVRGRRADAMHDEIQRLQAEGISKPDIARKLGVTIRTVDRHWKR